MGGLSKLEKLPPKMFYKLPGAPGALPTHLREHIRRLWVGGT